MKSLFLSIFLILAACLQTFTQNNSESYPVSFSNSELSNDIDVVVLPTPDIERLLIEDIKNSKNGTFQRVGVAIPCNLSLNNSGRWDNLKDGSRLWRLQIIVDDAVGLGLDMLNFELPENSKLFFYNQDRSQILGEFNYKDNGENKYFATDLIKGNSIILEYYEEANVSKQASFEIFDVSFVYKEVSSLSSIKGFEDSDYCEVNINCPEGDNWQEEKRGIAKIYLRVGMDYGFCTGSLINNEKNNCDTYFLTADHCGDGASAADLNVWRFYFNYEADSCETPTTNPSNNYTYGSELIAHGGDGGSTGSDFFLIKLNRTTYPEDWNLYFNGWDRSTTASSGGGVCIHHPSGDIKKISTYTNNLVTAQWNSNGLSSHWKVYWAATVTDKGVTEGGSSGSPIFNSSGKIVGKLTGGSSYCTLSNYPDYYGKFSYSWESNGTTSDKQLKPWLDPDDKEIITLDGLEYLDCMTQREELISNNLDIKIFPNPTSDHITISLNDISDEKEIILSIYNVMGELIKKENIQILNKKEIEFDFREFTKGVYLINIILRDKTYKEKIIFIK